MNRIAQHIANALSSAFVILPMAVWTLYHAATTKEYVTFISDMAILIGLLILRDEKIASETSEKHLKEDLNATKQIKNLLDSVLERML